MEWGTFVIYWLSSKYSSIASFPSACCPRPIDLLTADGLIPNSLATEASRSRKDSRTLSSWKISLLSIPRIITWWSAPGASILDWRGIHPFYHNERSMSIFHERPHIFHGKTFFFVSQGLIPGYVHIVERGKWFWERSFIPDEVDVRHDRVPFPSVLRFLKCPNQGDVEVCSFSI